MARLVFLNIDKYHISGYLLFSGSSTCAVGMGTVGTVCRWCTVQYAAQSVEGIARGAKIRTFAGGQGEGTCEEYSLRGLRVQDVGCFSGRDGRSLRDD